MLLLIYRTRKIEKHFNHMGDNWYTCSKTALVVVQNVSLLNKGNEVFSYNMFTNVAGLQVKERDRSK